MVKKQPNYKLHVLYGVTLGFLLVFITSVAKGKLSLVDTKKTESTLSSTFEGDSVDKALVGWGAIALILFSMAAFDSTASLAAAFAWLILISVLLLNAQVLLKAAGAYNTGAINGAGGGKKNLLL